MNNTMAYCDYIAHLVRQHALVNDSEDLLFEVGPVQVDLAPTGALRSTAKTLNVTDKNGKRYRVTVEEVV